MDTLKFKIGDKVNHITSPCMKNGTVTGVSIETNMIYVYWWQQGSSAIPINQLVLSEATNNI